MNITGNTILITGGGSGIGRGLAEELHKLGNQIIIAGRRKNALDETTVAHLGMKSLTLDIEDPVDIRAFAAQAAAEFPTLNVLINNAGIMRPENLLAQQSDLADSEATITTNLLGPIRLTAALLPHLQRQPHAAIVNVSSGLAFLPLALTPTYCATKAAIHSYTQSLRFQLEETGVEVIELMPPAVKTDMTAELVEGGGSVITTDELIKKSFAALKAGKLEIRPGQSNQLALLRRLAPDFINKQLWKASKILVPAV